MLKNYRIYVDQANGMIADFLSFTGKRSFNLPTDHSIPLLDQIFFQTKKDESILLIVAPDSLEKFLSNPSEYHDLRRTVNQGKIKLIISDEQDLCYGFSFFYYRGQRAHQYDTLRYLTGCDSVVLLDGTLDRKIKESFPRSVFYDQFHHAMLNPTKKFVLPELFVSAEQEERPYTFFTCYLNDTKRPHRVALTEKMSKARFPDTPLIKCGSFKLLRDTEELAMDIYDGGHYDPEWVSRNTVSKSALPNINYYSQSNIELVVEGLGFDHDESFDPSEKIFRSIYMKMPFMVVSNKNFLGHLKGLGFRTFDGLIDESYDSLDSVEDRAEKVVEILSKIDVRKAREIYHDSKEIRDHNRDNFLNMLGGYKSHIWRNCRNIFDDNL